MTRSTLTYPGAWRHPIPLHPAFSLPLPYEPLVPQTEGGRPKIVLIFTEREQQWWVASDRRWAAAQFTTGRVLQSKSLTPNKRRCVLLEANDVAHAEEVLRRQGHIPTLHRGALGQTWEHTTQPRLLAAQAWLDWLWIRDNHPLGQHLSRRGVEWWGDVYQTHASLRTLERAKYLLRTADLEVVNAVWEGHFALANALHFIELCPERTTQRRFMRDYGAAELADHFLRGTLPLDGMLATRIEKAIKALRQPSNEDIADTVQAVLDDWRQSHTASAARTSTKNGRRGKKSSRKKSSAKKESNTPKTAAKKTTRRRKSIR